MTDKNSMVSLALDSGFRFKRVSAAPKRRAVSELQSKRRLLNRSGAPASVHETLPRCE